MRKRINEQSLLIAAWVLVALVIAYYRSMWGDEWLRVKELKIGAVWAMRKILAEPSPFNPGEVLPNSLAMAVVTFFRGPVEIWARLQGIAWGAATVALALRYDDARAPAA